MKDETKTWSFLCVLRACMSGRFSCVWLLQPHDYSSSTRLLCLRGSPGARILEWAVTPPGDLPPGDRTHFSCITCSAGRVFTAWASREAHALQRQHIRGPLHPFFVAEADWWLWSLSVRRKECGGTEICSCLYPVFPLISDQRSKASSVPREDTPQHLHWTEFRGVILALWF